MTSEEEIKKMLKEIFEMDNSFNNNTLDYVSWELGFQRGMEYQQKLDNRVLNLHEGAKGFLNKFKDRLK